MLIHRINTLLSLITEPLVGNEKLTGLPKDYELYQNYPNPFNPTTTIRYGIPAAGEAFTASQNVTLKIFDILGNEVVTLVNEHQSVGYYEYHWDASINASGIYFYVLNAGKSREIKKMILIK